MFKLLRNKDIILRLQVFLMIFLSGGNVVANEIVSISTQMALWAVLVISLIAKAHIDINKKEFYYFLLLLLIVFMSDTVNGERISLTILMGIMLLVSYVFIARVSLESFAKSYADVMVFLCVTSLIGYTACLVVPSLQAYNLVDAGARSVANFYIYVHAPFSARNFGLFWEPGGFQAFISVALLFEIYRKDPNLLRFILFIVTSATTFSTTGYITIALMSILILLKNKGPVKVLRRAVVVFLPLAIFLIVANMTFLNGNESSVLGKLTAFQEGQIYNTNTAGETSTASVRYFSIVKPIEEFFSSPLLGCGYENLQKNTYRFTENMNTCTFVNYLAIYGVFYGIIMFLGYARFCSILERKKYLALFVFLLFFVITMSENLVRVPLFIMIPLYGIARSKFISDNVVCLNQNKSV